MSEVISEISKVVAPNTTCAVHLLQLKGALHHSNLDSLTPLRFLSIKPDSSRPRQQLSRPSCNVHSTFT